MSITSKKCSREAVLSTEVVSSMTFDLEYGAFYEGVGDGEG